MVSRTFSFTKRAKQDLLDILDYISINLCNVKAAHDFKDTLYNKIKIICEFPLSGKPFKNTYIKDFGIRKFIVKNYYVLYKF